MNLRTFSFVVTVNDDTEDTPEGWDFPADYFDVVPSGIEIYGDFTVSELGETVKWCQEHDAEGIENHGGASDECWRVVWADQVEPEGVEFPYKLCRMKQVRIIDIPEEGQ